MSRNISPRYDALSDLMVVIIGDGKKMRRHWAVDPDHDGLAVLFNKGAGNDGRRNLRRASTQLARDFFDAFTAETARPLPNGQILKHKIIDIAKAKDDCAVTPYWSDADKIARAIIARLEKTEPKAAENMRRYHKTACAIFSPA